MRLRALIVDDEPLAREGVALALRDAGGVEIVGESADGPSAVRSIRQLEPDLVFLDVKMPGLDGFEVIETIGVENMPAVVFLTAYDEYALRAFRVNAIDYLLKPIDTAAFNEALERARRRIAQDGWLTARARLDDLLEAVGAGGKGRELPDRIVVRAGGRVYLLAPEDVTWVEAAGDYVTIHATGKSHLVRDSLRSMEARLADYAFRRIHRSALVNLRCIKELAANDSGDYSVVLHDDTVLRLSRSYRDALYAALDAAP